MLPVPDSVADKRLRVLVDLFVHYIDNNLRYWRMTDINFEYLLRMCTKSPSAFAYVASTYRTNVESYVQWCRRNEYPPTWSSYNSQVQLYKGSNGSSYEEVRPTGRPVALKAQHFEVILRTGATNADLDQVLATDPEDASAGAVGGRDDGKQGGSGSGMYGVMRDDDEKRSGGGGGSEEYESAQARKRAHRERQQRESQYRTDDYYYTSSRSSGPPEPQLD